MLLTLFSGALLSAPAPAAEPAPVLASDIVAIRIGRAETVTHGSLEHAVVLVEDGKITAVGEDLPIERGIRIVDKPDWVLTPGLVSCNSGLGIDSQAGREFTPDQSAKDHLYLGQGAYRQVLEAGVTTLGLRAPGSGIPGSAVAIKPHGSTLSDVVLSSDAYLSIFTGADASLKKMFRDAWGEVAEYEEKVEKAREKWEKDQKKKKDDDDKKEDEGGFVPPEADPKVARFLDLREGRIHALMQIRKAADFLHLTDLVEEHDFEWAVRVPLRNDIDLFRVADQVGEAGVTIVLDPDITLQPNTRRDRNIPAEMARAGARVALVPPSDSAQGHEDWMKAVAQLVRAGLDVQDAYAAVTLVPAEVLGLEERIGSIAVGKDANLVFWDGDPLEPTTEVVGVMLEGHMVHGDLD